MPDIISKSLKSIFKGIKRANIAGPAINETILSGIESLKNRVRNRTVKVNNIGSPI